MAYSFGICWDCVSSFVHKKFSAFICTLTGTGSSELKRKLEETFGPEDAKKKKIEGDVSADLVSKIVAEITQPEQMVGPDVSFILIGRDEIQ